MKGLAFRSSLIEKPSTPEEETLDIRTVLPPPPNVYLRRPPTNQSDNHLYITEDAIPKQIKRVLNETENNDSLSVLDMLILLRRGKQLTKYSKDRLNNGLVCCYLGIMYYKTGLLEEAFQQFLLADTAIKEHIDAKKLSLQAHLSETEQSFSNLSLQSKWIKIRGQIHLQLCILLSEIQRHQLALKHAQIGIKLFYQVAANYYLISRGSMLNRSTNNKLHPYIDETVPKNNNLVGLANKLLSIMKDLKYQYLPKHKITQLEAQNGLAETYKFQQPYHNIEAFTNQIISKSKWILNNKILNQVQMEILKKEEYQESHEITSNTFLEIVVYLSVGLYCQSTESRFIEKQHRQKYSSSIIPESENWLSRALEIAYSFLPIQAPILGQIYSVHDKFYGLGKQPIPEDGELEGQVKFLKQTRKASSVYDKKTMLLCAPVLVRMNQISQFSAQKSTLDKSKHLKMRSLTIDLNQQKYKNQSKRTSLQKIYKKNGRKLTKIKANSSLQHRKDTPPSSLTQEDKRPASTDFSIPKLSRLKNPKIDIQINNNINLFISNQKSFDDKILSSELRSTQKQAQFFQNKKVVLKIIPNKDSSNKRNIYHSKRKHLIAHDIDLSQI